MAKGFTLKKENYTAVADFITVSFERDLASFTEVFKTMDAAYLQAFKKANSDLKNAASLLDKKQKQKQATHELYAMADAFREKLILLKAYAKRAGVETPLLQETINAVKSRNIEKVIKNTRDMLPVLTQNAEKIGDMPTDFFADVPDTINGMESKNTEQNKLINEAIQANVDEKPLYDTVYKFISEIAEAGKIVYKDSSKKDEYTISKIVARVETSSK